MGQFFGGEGVNPGLKGLTSNVLNLQPGQCWTISPAGWYELKPGKYTIAQEQDPITGIWRAIGGGSTGASLERIWSDGVNYRLANQSGCVVGALLTVAGSGYTSPPTVTAAAGNAIFRAIVGGAVGLTGTSGVSPVVTNGGFNYTYPPAVIFAAPPPGGIQATGYCTLTNSQVTSITVTDQGAGYASPPVVTFVNDPREGVNGVTQGYGATAVSTLTGAGTVTGILVIDHGTAVAGPTPPVLTISGGGGASAAATAIMNWAVTAYTVSTTTAGSGYVAPVLISGYGGFPATNPAYVNPTTQSGLVRGRAASLLAALATSGAITATGQTLFDGGSYPGAPTMYVASNNVPGAGAVAVVFLTPTLGGIDDTSIVLTT